MRNREAGLTMILKSHETRLNYDLLDYKLSTRNVYAIHRLNDSNKEQLINQLKARTDKQILPVRRCHRRKKNDV